MTPLRQYAALPTPADGTGPVSTAAPVRAAGSTAGGSQPVTASSVVSATAKIALIVTRRWPRREPPVNRYPVGARDRRDGTTAFNDAGRRSVRAEAFVVDVGLYRRVLAAHRAVLVLPQLERTERHLHRVVLKEAADEQVAL